MGGMHGHHGHGGPISQGPPSSQNVQSREEEEFWARRFVLMSFDVPMNLFIPTASLTWKSLRRVDVVWAVCMDTMDTAALDPKVHHHPKMFRVARRKNSGLAGLFFHSCTVLVVLTPPFTLHSAFTATSMSSIKCECTVFRYLRFLIVECFYAGTLGCEIIRHYRQPLSSPIGRRLVVMIIGAMLECHMDQ